VSYRAYPEFPPDNELPTSLDGGSFTWRGADVGITATGFQVYSTGVFFTLIALSRGTSLQKEDPLDSWAGEREAYGEPDERPAGSLRLGARDARMISHNAGLVQHRLHVDSWTPFPPDGDLVFYLEWLAEGIGYSEFCVPRSAAAKAVVLWPADFLADRARRHRGLTPSFLVHVEPWAEGSDLMRLRLVQQGPSSIDHLDSLTLHIYNDDSYWPDERNVVANGHNYDDVRNQVWAPYRFTPGSGPGEARADVNGREVAYEALLPAGEELAFQLEPTRPGTWTGSMTQEEWQRQRGNVIRLGITPAHAEHGTWHGLLAEIKVIPGKARSTFLGHSGSRNVPPGGLVLDSHSLAHNSEGDGSEGRS
jgi:hypothetical protein